MISNRWIFSILMMFIFVLISIEEWRVILQDFVLFLFVHRRFRLFLWVVHSWFFICFTTRGYLFSGVIVELRVICFILRIVLISSCWRGCFHSSLRFSCWRFLVCGLLMLFVLTVLLTAILVIRSRDLNILCFLICMIVAHHSRLSFITYRSFMSRVCSLGRLSSGLSWRLGLIGTSFTLTVSTLLLWGCQLPSWASWLLSWDDLFLCFFMKD